MIVSPAQAGSNRSSGISGQVFTRDISNSSDPSVLEPDLDPMGMESRVREDFPDNAPGQPPVSLVLFHDDVNGLARPDLLPEPSIALRGHYQKPHTHWPPSHIVPMHRTPLPAGRGSVRPQHLHSREKVHR